MASGMRVSMDHGFDFATEERGVALRRVQTDLSEARLSKVNLASGEKGKETPSRILSISRMMKRRHGAGGGHGGAPAPYAAPDVPEGP